jgi:transcriptional regulator with XRE-family HTH domain
MSRKNDKISLIGQEILQAIEKQHITKTDLCKKMDISRSTLYSWINGATAPDHNELQTLYKILNIRTEQLNPVRLMKDIIEDGNYIGMHKRVYDQLEENWATNRELIRQLVAKLTS